MNAKPPPRALLRMVGWVIAAKQALAPGKPVDLPFLPRRMRIMMRGISQFDGNFARAFVDGSAGTDFDHAETLSRIQQPVLFLHANFFIRDGRLMGALDDEDVARAQELVRGPWSYVRMDCGHAIALEEPEREAREITAWHLEVAAAR